MFLIKLVITINLISLSASATDYKYIGKCSWDTTKEDTYGAGYALAEFFLEINSGVVYVKNYIDEEGGHFLDIPEIPQIEELQGAGRQGVRNFLWDEGRSKVTCAGPLNQVNRCTSTVNSLGSNGNVYAPCFFISE